MPEVVQHLPGNLGHVAVVDLRASRSRATRRRMAASSPPWPERKGECLFSKCGAIRSWWAQEEVFELGHVGEVMRKAIDLITSLKLTICCLSAAMVLVFAGTLAQVHHGIDIVQERYFQGFFVWWPPDAHGFQFPIFPGGHLIGGVLLIDLIAAHARRFRWGWRRLGIHLTHAGLIIMLAGGLLTDLFAVRATCG